MRWFHVKRVEEPVSLSIKIRPSTKRKIESLKIHPKESYDGVITRLIAFAEQYKELFNGYGGREGSGQEASRRGE